MSIFGNAPRRLWLAICVAGLLVISLLPHQALANTLPQLPGQLKPRATPTPAGEGPVTALEDVQRAVVRIEATGTFRDPAEGMMMGAGSGSGFLIDAEGRAVTNNHVVTGGAFYKVYVDGMEDPVNARVLGVSECADLAVIDLDGKGYPYLAWYDQPIKVGLEIYAAGFPLGDPEYTLTKGIVSKARADGESNWASVDKVIQHDAVIDHGNSGGPLVTEDGRVVGVNYAGIMDANQFFSISAAGAMPVVEQLLQKLNVDTIGVNGEAFVDEEAELSGIWVASVASGSPADDAGMKPGDILLAMEGLPLAEDGTMATYCEILRSHGPGDKLAIEVYRPDAAMVYEGQLNGRLLAESYAVDDASSTTDAQAGTDGGEYTEYMAIGDEANTFSLEVPTAWKDVAEQEWAMDDEPVGIRLTAAPDLQEFYDKWGIPGVTVSYSAQLPETMTLDELLDRFDLSSSCTDGGRSDLPDGELVGIYQIWTDCTDAENSALIFAVQPKATQDYYAVVEIYGSSAADDAARERIISSFVVAPPAVDEDQATTTTDSDLFDLVDTSDLVYEYVAVTDPAVVGLIPAEYSDTSTSTWENSDGEVIGFIFKAAPDLAKFNDSWAEPGLIAWGAQDITEELDPDEMLASDNLSENCTYDDRYTDEHTIGGITYNIAYDFYTECGGTDSSYLSAIAQTDPPDQLLYLEFGIASDADAEAADVLLSTFALDAQLAAEALAEATAEQETEDIGPTFASVVDDTGVIAVNVPESWSDVQSKPWELDDGPVGDALVAAPDVQGFEDTWDVPGVFIAVSPELGDGLDPVEALEFFDLSADCTYDDQYEYTTDNLAGAYDVWLDCGDVEGGQFVVLAAEPVDAATPLIFLYMNMPTADDTAAFGEVLNSLAIAGAVTSAEESAAAEEPAALADAAVAVVNAEKLNVRSGPGTNFSRVHQVDKDTALTVLGQYEDCAWLQIVTPTGVEGWVSGRAEYVSLDQRCADLPAADAPSAPPADTGASSGGGAGSAAGGDTGTSNTTQGCYTFQNLLGAELTITFTDADGKGTTFKVPASQEVERCFAPGRYTYTLDAPPPWGTTNDTLTVEPGDNYLFPISAE